MPPFSHAAYNLISKPRLKLVRPVRKVSTLLASPTNMRDPDATGCTLPSARRADTLRLSTHWAYRSRLRLRLWSCHWLSVCCVGSPA